MYTVRVLLHPHLFLPLPVSSALHTFCKCFFFTLFAALSTPLPPSPFPSPTVEAASMRDGLLSAAAQVSRNFTSYSEELMGK